MSKVQEVIKGYRSLLTTLEDTIEFKDSIIKQYSEQVITLIGRNNDLTEQVAYWQNLYHELKNTEGKTE